MKRILLIFGAIILTFIIIIFAFISPIAKYLIQKNSVEWTGRRIEIGSLFINIFSGGVTAGGLKVYEAGQEKLFFYSKKIQASVSLPKLIAGKFDIKEFSIDSLSVSILQTGDHFNYDD